MPASIGIFTSQKLRFWFFASMIMLLFVHSYNLNQRYLQPFTIVNEKLTINSFVQYFLSNGLFRFFIPMLFAISGYLYTSHDERPYRVSIGKRTRTIFLPYLIWSAVGLALTYIIERSAYGRGIINATQLLTLSGNRILLHDYKWYELVLRWILLPVPYQLWFLRVLFLYNLAYPALRWCIFNWPKIFFFIVILFWLSEIGLVLFEGEGLLFFSLGIWLQKTGFNISAPKKWLNPWPWGVSFVLLAIIKTILAFKGFIMMGNTVFPVLLVLHKTTVFCGFIAAWFGCDLLVKYCMNNRAFTWLASFSFIIYVLHAPLVAYAINAIFPFVQQIPNYRFLTYIFLPAGLFIFCVLTGALIRFIWPKLFAILTGGRGL